MPRGGKRSGSGRKKGGANKKTAEIANRAALEGITPLEVMLYTMREHFHAGRFDKAAAIAKDAAPYIHPRLSAVEAKIGGKDGGPIPFTFAETPASAPDRGSVAGG